MRRTADISDCELLPLAAALRSKSPVVRAQLVEGGGAIAPLPMLWPSPGVGDDLDWPHRREAPVHSADLYVVGNAKLGGHGAHPTLDGHYLHAAGWNPYYIKAYIDQDLDADRWRFDPSKLRRRRLKQAWALTHFNLMYGHWLTEIFPKLFAIRMLGELGVRAPILLPSSAPVWVKPIIRDVLRGQKLIIYDPLRDLFEVERLLLPPMLQHDYVFHPALTGALDAYAQRCRRPGEAERLFVSRAGMRTDYAFRELVNDAEIEAVAEGLGFRVVRPEMMPWRKQVSMFASARVIAGEFGSGLHNTLFSPRGASVVSFNWITDLQSLIGNFRGQRLGYVLPDDGHPRRFTAQGELQRFRVEPEEARRKLALAIEAAEGGQPNLQSQRAAQRLR